MKKISIIIPCFNDGKYLLDAIKSAAPAIEMGAEVIVVNDGSTDLHTLDVLTHLPGPIVVLHKENGGLSSARNYGIAQAKGDFICPLDSDDLLNHRFLSAALDILRRNDALDIVTGPRVHFEGETITKGVAIDPIRQIYINGLWATALYRKSVWEKLGGYDETMVNGYEDWEFWLHAMSLGMRFEKIDIPVYFYRVRMDSMVRKKTIDNHSSILAYMHQKHQAFFLKLYIEQVNAKHELRNDYRQLLKALFQVFLRKLVKNK